MMNDEKREKVPGVGEKERGTPQDYTEKSDKDASKPLKKNSVLDTIPPPENEPEE